MSGSVCGVCNLARECRAYGVGATMICFDCMKDPAHPEREIEARKQVKQLLEQIDAAGGVPVIDGKSKVRPLEQRDLLDDAAPVTAFVRKGGSR